MQSKLLIVIIITFVTNTILLLFLNVNVIWAAEMESELPNPYHP